MIKINDPKYGAKLIGMYMPLLIAGKRTILLRTIAY